MGLTSRSGAIFVAAWKPCTHMTKVNCSISIAWPSSHSGEMTHLDPIHEAGDVGGLQQKLLSLHADADHIPSFQVVAPQPALCAMQGVRMHQVLLLRLWDVRVVDPEVSMLDTRRTKCAG